jgi:REP element-mobilizing transposase RayT
MIPPCLITVAPMCRVAPIFSRFNTYRRQTFLTDVDVRSALREAIGTLRLTHPFVIEAWVLLPDHMHALWTLPPGDEDFSHRRRVVKRMAPLPKENQST